jgi:exoribonuclease R
VPTPKLTVAADIVRAADVQRGMAQVRAELEVPDGFPVDVIAAAERAAGAGAWRREGRPDRTAVELVTIDPPGSRDLDQAFGAERRRAGGFRVWYAIADVAAFVEPGGAVDAECHRRGVTLYGPDRRDPLHPPSLGEGAGSLLPDGERPALLWSMDLDSAGAPVATRLERAVVRSRAQLTYQEVIDRLHGAGTSAEMLVLLREIGRLRQAAEAARGGVSLPLPDQVVEPVGAIGAGGDYRLRYESPIVSEGWNAQISLLAGMEAARIMIEGGTGLLRTLPPPDERTRAWLRHSAKALGMAWPTGAALAAVTATRRSCARSIQTRPWARRCSCRRRGRCAALAMPGSRAGSCPTIPRMPPSPPPTPTSRRRCGASATAPPTRWCSRSWPALPSPSGLPPR